MVLAGWTTSYRASGFLISNDTLVTASHNLFEDAFGGWCDYLIIYPCTSDSYPTSPYGYTTSGQAWIGAFHNTGYHGDDWGVAKLDKAYSIGYLGMTTNSSNEKGRSVRVQGYPGRLNSAGNPSDTVTANINYNLYLATGKITSDQSDYLKYTDAMVYAAMSGGPVLYKNSNDKWVAGGIISAKTANYSLYCAFDNNLYNQIIALSKV